MSKRRQAGICCCLRALAADFTWRLSAHPADAASDCQFELCFAGFRTLKQVPFVSPLVTQESFSMLYTSSLECTCAVLFAELRKAKRNNEASFPGATVLLRQDLSLANAVNVLPVNLMGAVNGKAGMEPEGPPPKSKIVVS